MCERRLDLAQHVGAGFLSQVGEDRSKMSVVLDGEAADPSQMEIEDRHQRLQGAG